MYNKTLNIIKCITIDLDLIDLELWNDFDFYLNYFCYQFENCFNTMFINFNYVF